MARAPLVALQGFVQVARHASLSRAAEQMNLTVSALSHQIRALEQRMSQRLFIRGPRGVRLTDAGERLLQTVGPALDSIEQVFRPLPQRSDDALSLSMLATFASGWLMPRLPRFVARHPQIELQLNTGIDLVDFSRQPFDAALRFGAGVWPGVSSVPLFEEWLTPVASPKLLGRRKLRGAEDLARLPLLGDPGGRWKDWFALYGGTPPKRFVAQFGDTETLHRAALEGLGVALGRMSMTRALIEAGRLVALTPQRLRAEWSHYLVYPPRSETHPAVRAFRTWIVQEAAEYQKTNSDKRAPSAGSGRRMGTP
ncbi:MAG: LysR substrate-binding domain-containing protein [Tahibacter sp.]